MANMIRLSDDDLRELFALFSSPTAEEIEQIYSEKDRLFFRNEDLREEYTLVQDKESFAEDAWRAVMYFLQRHGYELRKDGESIDLGVFDL